MFILVSSPGGIELSASPHGHFNPAGTALLPAGRDVVCVPESTWTRPIRDKASERSSKPYFGPCRLQTRLTELSRILTNVIHGLTPGNGA